VTKKNSKTRKNAEKLVIEPKETSDSSRLRRGEERRGEGGEFSSQRFVKEGEGGGG